MRDITSNKVLEDLILEIERIVLQAKENIAISVNQTMKETYWIIVDQRKNSLYKVNKKDAL